MLEKVKERLESFGYILKDGDEAVIAFSVQKVEGTIKNDCNIPEVPDGLLPVAVDMAAGEFLLAKKTFSPGDIAGLDLSPAVKQIQAGDTNTVFVTGDAGMTPEQRLDNLISYLLTHGREELSCYRKLRW